MGAHPAAITGIAVTPVRIVLDTDTDIGTDIDDTWAIAQAIRSPALDVGLITTVSGDPLYRARATAALLHAGGRDDIPVAAGIGGNGRPEQPQSRLPRPSRKTTRGARARGISWLASAAQRVERLRHGR